MRLIIAAAVVAVAGLLAVAVLGPGDEDASPSPRLDSAAPSPGGAARARAVAERFALAARDWTFATFRRSYERQIALAGGAYGRALERQRPRRAVLAQLRAERAANRARIVAVGRAPPIGGPIARYLLTIEEVTRASGARTTSVARYLAVLRHMQGRWRVARWTVIPEPEGGLG